jgi:hypothetical protein
LPHEGRQDTAFVETLRERGVPADQVVELVDEKGTLAAIRKQFVALLKKTRKGDFLIFYYCGHGGRVVTGSKSRYYLNNYDCKVGDDGTFLCADQVFDMIEAHFKGSHALVTADCCFSGGMLEEARKRKSGIAYACLASVFAHNVSYGGAFTRRLIKGFRGDATMDANGDGAVRLGEMAHAIELEMAYVEKQHSAFLPLNGFDPAMRIAPAKKKSHPDVGKIVEAHQDGKWYLAQVVDYKNDRFHVDYVHYKNEREWVTAKRLRPFKPSHLEDGTKVLARPLAKKEDHKWHPAVVRRSLNGLHFVRFDHDKSPNGVLDVWVPPDRIKLRP